MSVLTVTSTADSGAGSLRQAIADAVSGDTIVFDVSLEVDGIITVLLSSQLALPAKNLTIDGGSHTGSDDALTTRVVLDAQQLDRVVYGHNINSVSFFDVTFKNGYSSNGGGVFLRNNNANENAFTNCVFDANVATTNGGGVYASADSVNTFTNCVLKNNQATTGGGAILLNTSANTFAYCIFKSNASINDPSDIRSASTGTQTFNNSRFKSETNRNVSIQNGTNLFANTCYVYDLRITTANGITILGALTVNSLSYSNAPTFTFSGVDSILAVTTTATIGSATFTAAENSTGYLALPSGTTAPTVGAGVKVCTYGADLETFTIDFEGATWTAQNLSTPILIEQQSGSTWDTLTDNATGGTYSTTFAEGDTARSFDGVQFITSTIPVTPPPVSYLVVKGWAIPSNGGGSSGDSDPSWVIEPLTITPNIEEL